VHRCEVQWKPRPACERTPIGLLTRSVNPFATHSLVHLGVVREQHWKVIAVAARYDGFTNLRRELLDLCPSRDQGERRAEFEERIAAYVATTSELLPQPVDLYAANRERLQGEIDALVQAP